MSVEADAMWFVQEWQFEDPGYRDAYWKWVSGPMATEGDARSLAYRSSRDGGRLTRVVVAQVVQEYPA